jgi:hypothetical protein
VLKIVADTVVLKMCCPSSHWYHQAVDHLGHDQGIDMVCGIKYLFSVLQISEIRLGEAP